MALPNSSPQAGHFILSKSTRCISAGVMTFPHFGQIVSRDASTFVRLIFLRLTITTFYLASRMGAATVASRKNRCSMICDVPIVSFDTSAHNRLVEDGPLSEPVLAGLKSGLSFRFVGLSIEEMAATANPTKRDALFAYCSRIQDSLSECIYPPNELIKRMVIAHTTRIPPLLTGRT